MSKALCLLLVLCSHALCGAAEPWDKTDKTLLATGLVLKTVDYFQTQEVARDPDRWEVNPVMGKHPSRGKVNRYFAVSAIVQWGVAHFLPSSWRKPWLGFWIGVSGTNVYRNYRGGVRVHF